AGGAAQAQGWQTTYRRPSRAHGHHLRTQDRHPVGDAASRDGLRLRTDLLAAPQRMARSRGVGAAAQDAARPSGAGRPDRLVQGLARLSGHTRSRGAKDRTQPDGSRQKGLQAPPYGRPKRYPTHGKALGGRRSRLEDAREV
ncbi:MAG: Mobile element protein, partial [uncultured Rubrobacteraceae bacterium]